MVPVGGTREGSEAIVPLLPGETFIEPMSNKPVRVGGAYLRDTEVLPSSGSYQSLLDMNTLACEARALDALRHYKEALSGEMNRQFI